MSQSSGQVAELVYRMKRGPIRLTYWILDRLLDANFDRRFGIHSSARQKHEELGLHSEDFEDYQPLSYLDLRSLLGSVPIRSSDVFLDYGCGMGRPVCVAATYAFRAVYGVELSTELCRIAERNIASARPRFHAAEVRIINANAASFAVPDDINFVFFFNPFGGEVLNSTLLKLRESLMRSPRKLRLVFCGTLSAERFRAEALRHDWLQLESERTLTTGVLSLLYSNR
jgi:SAM-dependent methyltransferase